MVNLRKTTFPYLPKDFIETHEGLIFAVVSYQPQDNKVGCFLRYIPIAEGWQKVDTEQANTLLVEKYPHYLYQSEQFDTAYHAVAEDNIAIHHRPECALNFMMQRHPLNVIEQKLQKLLPILQGFGAEWNFLGLTGSMLINQHKPTSDIDLVVYGREQFFKTRQAIQQATAEGFLDVLDASLMAENYIRRGSALGFDEFAWHEHRKFNKSAIDGTKFDIGMVCLPTELDKDDSYYQKQGRRIITTKVINDDRAFDFPACYWVDDALTPQIMVFTHTYIGQARAGELIEVSGTVECNTATGQSRLIVGSTREAEGEYIKVSR